MIDWPGVKDSERVVRNAALFALGQFAEHLQPEISQYHSNLMPVLVQFMDEAILSLQARPQEKTGVTKIFYALETFCEHLGEDLIVYLPTLMEKLFYAITTTNVRIAGGVVNPLLTALYKFWVILPPKCIR